jgi:hypothetical protein
MIVRIISFWIIEINEVFVGRDTFFKLNILIKTQYGVLQDCPLAWPERSLGKLFLLDHWQHWKYCEDQ